MVDIDTSINDTRERVTFKTMTFSGYKKTSVLKELTNSIINGRVEESSNWTAELICSGYYIELWDTIISIVCRNIHTFNPKLPIYITLQMTTFKEIVSNGYGDNILGMRNNSTIRILFSNIITVLSESIKKHTINSDIKIKKEDLDIKNIRDKLHAPDLNQTECYHINDPKELFVFANEFAYSLKQNDLMMSCYWIEWVISYSAKNIKIFPREWPDVGNASKTDTIWLVWDIILEQVKVRNDKLSTKIIESLLSMFCLKYTKGVIRRRKYTIYYAVSILTEIYDNKIPIIKDKDIVDNVASKLHIIYKAIKKNENNPIDTGMSDKDKITASTMKKITLLNKMIM